MAPTVYTPPVNTYIPIGSVTLSAATSEVVFSSLPTSGYRDLVLVMNGQTAATDNIGWQANGDTGTNYQTIQALGGTSGAVSNATARPWGFAGTSYAQPSVNITQWLDYSATDKDKTTLGRANSPTNEAAMTASRWANTSAITSLRIFPSLGGNFAIGSTFSLYAIAG